MKLPQEELDRLYEVLVYLYFDKLDDELVKNPNYWTGIRNLCISFKISDICLMKAVRILLIPDNIPTEIEMYYLFDKIGLTVRPIRKISGIYWQKQKEYKTILKDKTVAVSRKILDPAMKNTLKGFVSLIYKISGIFSIISEIDLEE
jgi:hypothetical protein